MEELNSEFINTFLGELVRGPKVKRKTVQGKPMDFVDYQVTEMPDTGDYKPYKVELSVGGEIVFKKEYATKYGSNVEIQGVQVRAIREMINSIPFLYRAVARLQSKAPKTMEEQALKAFQSVVDVINKLQLVKNEPVQKQSI